MPLRRPSIGAVDSWTLGKGFWFHPKIPISLITSLMGNFEMNQQLHK